MRYHDLNKIGVIMKKICSVILLVSSYSAFATDCKINSLTDLTVYTSGSINSQQSDYQGTIAAGGNIKLSRFYVDQTKCNSIISAGSVEFTHGSVSNGIEALNSAHIGNANIPGGVKSNGQVSIFESSVPTVNGTKNVKVVNSAKPNINSQKISPTADFTKLTTQMHNLSKVINLKKVTTSASVENNAFEIKADKKVNVLRIKSLNLKKVVISANEDQQVYINIDDVNQNIIDLNVELKGTITSSQIVWNFPLAKTLFITNTHSGDYGIPGTVLAPNAQITFYEGLIHGALYASSIVYEDPKSILKSGQINDGRLTNLPLE